MQFPEKVDVIVVGAGIAGLAAADRLRAQGRNVVVLESENKPGGRMASIALDGVVADLGAQFIATEYKNILAKSHEIGLEAIKLNIKKTGIHNGSASDYFNPESAISLLRFKGLSPLNRMRAMLGLGWIIIKPPYISVEHLEDGIELDSENAAPYFAKTTGKNTVPNLLNPVLNGLAFYDLSNSSAAYFKAAALKLLTLKTMSYRQGVGELARQLASKVTIAYGARVIAIERRPTMVHVKVQHNRETFVIIAPRVIVAVPGDRVLDHISNPTDDEMTFFSSVRYTSAAIIHCRANTGLPDNNSVLFFRPAQEKRVAAIHSNPYAKDQQKSYFVVTLANDYAVKYMNGDVKDEEFRQLIESKLGTLDELQILHAQPWPSAVPIYYPGYISKIVAFLKKVTPQDQILYCGDYLKGGYTEAAFTSGLEVANLIQSNKTS